MMLIHPSCAPIWPVLLWTIFLNFVLGADWISTFISSIRNSNPIQQMDLSIFGTVRRTFSNVWKKRSIRSLSIGRHTALMEHQTHRMDQFECKMIEKRKENTTLDSFFGREWNLCWSNYFIGLWSFSVSFSLLQQTNRRALLFITFLMPFIPAIHFNFSLSCSTCFPFYRHIFFYSTDR